MRGADYVVMARRRAGLTQRELAERLGCRQATIARWERGDRQVSVEDVETIAAACGLHLEGRLVPQDRSWWSQIALQLEMDPLDRLRRLTPALAPGLAAGVEALAAASADVVVIGDVAGALQGWPFVLGGRWIEVCPDTVYGGVALADLGRPVGRNRRELAGGVLVKRVDVPAGTRGFEDLRRGADLIATPAGTVRVASVVDLLRIADASRASSADRERLAYQAVLDVIEARRKPRPQDDRSQAEQIDAWLKQQTPDPDVAGPSDPERAALLEVFVRHEVRFILIGGAAIQSHGRAYVTQDIDLTPDIGDDNLSRLADALNDLDCRLVIDPENPSGWVSLPADYFTPKALRAASVWNLATRHDLIDLSFTPSAFPGGFQDLVAHANPMPAAGTGVTVLVASLDDVHASKRAAGRPKDDAYFRAHGR